MDEPSSRSTEAPSTSLTDFSAVPPLQTQDAGPDTASVHTVQFGHETDTPEFELGEDAPRNREARAQQEARWQQSKIDARHHFSAREALHVQKPAILRAINDFQCTRLIAELVCHPNANLSMISKLDGETARIIVEMAMPGHGPLLPVLIEQLRRRPQTPTTPADDPAGSVFSIFVRVRPLTALELSAGEYVSLDAKTSRVNLVCHDARLELSGRRLSMMHRCYDCDRVFDQDASDEDVCASLLLPLLARVVGGEGDSTVLLYGQTGGGKTHNLLAFIRCVQAELDALGSAVEVVFFEVGRNGCFDLLNERSKVALRADACDRVHVRGAATTTASTGDELASVLDGGLALRSTLATEANPMSSRSHAILAVTFTSSGRTLRLVDLAGSERNYETHYMSSRQFQLESAAINTALMSLKRCLHAAAERRDIADAARRAAVRIPYRASNLTRVLRDCFEDECHLTSVLAAVSPAAASTIHTLNTMDHVLLTSKTLKATSFEVNLPCVDTSKGCGYDGVPVHQWTSEQLIEWISNAEGGRFAQVVLPPGIDGQALLGLSARGLSDLVETDHAAGRNDGEGWYVSSQARVGRALFSALREAQSRFPMRR
mmetsp:Transcript_32325/g.70847  ORF Transcript_32325/g.70847 Transcript_32325/m.70847 type:complete len:604 (-) Transcript_32325:560-2371(-)